MAHLDRAGAGLARVAFLNDQHRHHNFLRHRTAVHKAGTAHKVKAPCPLGHEKVHTAIAGLSACRVSSVTRPSPRHGPQATAQDVALLAFQHARHALLHHGAVSFLERRLLVQKPVVSREIDGRAVQVVDDETYQI